ncbi:unannotated protein [freshwater metagenome]|uniref:Unannotated protein n=1 Tax=freshwater metagenome TaxID=449393 RepID=A0A6J5Z869_9ZZZZ
MQVKSDEGAIVANAFTRWNSLSDPDDLHARVAESAIKLAQLAAVEA